MPVTLLLEMPSGATLVLGFFLALLAALNGIQWWHKESTSRLKGEVEKWKTAAEAGGVTVRFAESELAVVRERSNRLEIEKEAQSKEIAVLRAKTDLEALRIQASGIEQAMILQAKQSHDMHDALLAGMTELTATVRDMHERFVSRDAQYADFIQSQSELIKSLQSQLNLTHAMK